MNLLAALVGGLIVASPAWAHSDQWRDKQWHLSFLKASQVHKITKGNGVTVAVVDTGVNGDHPDLRGNVLKGRDFDEGSDGWRDTNGHGTAMASLIAGHGHGPNGRDGILGLAPEAKVLPVRIPRSEGDDLGTRGADSKRGLQWATRTDVQVINLSGSGYGMRREVKDVLAADIVMVAAAGNTSDDYGVQPPAKYPGVIAVSGLDRNRNFTDTSVDGPEVVLSAPAVDIAAAGAGKRGKYNTSTGTSNAAALVSATAALVRAKFPHLTAGGVINRMIKTADDKGPPGRDDKYGFGVINPLKALTADIPDVKANPLLDPSASPSTPTNSPAAAAPGGAQSDSDDYRYLPLALAITGGLVGVIAGGLYLAVRRSRRTELQHGATPPSPSPQTGPWPPRPPPNPPPR